MAEDTCFVVMPFGGDHDSDFTSIIRPAIEQAGLSAVRADDLFTPGNVIDQIWERITQSKVVLADTTGRNPNVFYELGLAHAAQRPVLLITQEIHDIPFDLRALRHIAYRPRSPDWAACLKDDIKRGLRDILSDPPSAVLSTFQDVGATAVLSIDAVSARLLRIEEAVGRLSATASAANAADQRDGPLPLEPTLGRLVLRDGRVAEFASIGGELRIRVGHHIVSVASVEEIESALEALGLDRAAQTELASHTQLHFQRLSAGDA